MTDTTVIREVETGHVRGSALPTHTAFYSIPYAAAPLGRARFEHPRPHAPWTGTRDATTPGPTAPQLPRGRVGPFDFTTYFAPGWVPGADYLTVNIWTPPQAPPYAFRQAPVMVFVHGGAFIAGSSHSPLIDGRRFAEHGVIVVTVNYRLGLPGFLDLDDAPRNRGLADVLAALNWVRRNIATFGGDPTNITLAGHSAGAILTAAAIAAPEAAGLFHRAIMQSGSGTAAFTPQQAEIVREAAAKTLGIQPTLEAFAALTDEELLTATPVLTGIDLATDAARDPLQMITPFGVVLGEQPATTLARGAGHRVDLLIGHNTEEGNLYLLPSGAQEATTLADLHQAAAYAHPCPDELLQVYTALHPGATHGELRARILGDAAFGAGTRAMADAHADTAHGHTTHAYAFEWRSTAMNGRLGATHIVEVPFVFDVITPRLNTDGRLLGPAPLPARLAQTMHRAWIEFVTTGSPGWQPYTTTDRATKVFGDRCTVALDPYASVRPVWHTRPWPRSKVAS